MVKFFTCFLLLTVILCGCSETIYNGQDFADMDKAKELCEDRGGLVLAKVTLNEKKVISAYCKNETMVQVWGPRLPSF